MTKLVITGHNEVFGPWIASRLKMGTWIPGRGETIGLLDTNRGPVACALYTDHNEASVIVHLASEGRGWLNREFLWFGFYYPFIQLGVQKLIAPVESENTASRRFCESCGYTLEATLKKASPKGDLLLYTMEQQDCKWLSLRNSNVQAQGSRPA